MTILEVGERVWRYPPATKAATHTSSRKGSHWAVSSKRHPRLYLVFAFIAIDVAIFWFGLSMSGLTVSGSAANAPRALPLGNGAVLGSATSGPRSVPPADLALAPLVGTPVAATAAGRPVVAGSPALAASSPGATASTGGVSATPPGPTSPLSPPKTGQSPPPPTASPPRSSTGPAAPLPVLPALLPAVGQAATTTVNGLVDVLAPVVQGVDTTVGNTVNSLLKPAKLPLLGGK
jgi:hypothetical protein